MQQFIDLVTAQATWLSARITQLAKEHNYHDYTLARHMNWDGFISRIIIQLKAAPSMTQWLEYFCTSFANKHRAMGVEFTIVLGLLKIIRQSLHELIDRGAFAEPERGLQHQLVNKGFNELEESICQTWLRAREDQKVVELERTIHDLVGQRAIYESIYIHVSEPIFVLNRDSIIQSMNPAAIELLPIRIDEAVGKPLASVFSWLAPVADDLLRGDTVIEAEVESSSSLRCYQLKLTPLPSLSRDQADQVALMLTDVTRMREKTSELLKTTDELTFLNNLALELADASLDDGISCLVAKRLRVLTGAVFSALTHHRSHDGSWHVYGVDAACDDLKRIEQILGRSPIGMAFQMDERSYFDLSCGHLLLIDSLYEMAQGCLTAEQASAAEETFGTGECYGLAFLYKGQPVGTAVFVMPKSQPLDRSKTSVIESFANLSAIALQRSIAERNRKRAELALVESEARYRELFETSCDGIVVLDHHGHFIDCNRSYLDLLGYMNIDELRSKTFLEITPPEYHALDLRVITEELPTKGYSDEYEKEYFRKDGSRVPVSVRAWTPSGEEHFSRGRWAIVRDISPLRWMEESSNTMEKYRVLGELAAAISHEVRNPLTTVRGFLQYFSSKPNYDTEDIEFFELMIKELDSATTIISDFLDTARPSKLKVQEFDLAATVSSLCRVMESRALLQKVELITEAAEPILVRGDTGQIRQVLINLLQNALQAMPTGGILKVKCSIQDLMGRIEIADTGVGIAPENLEKIGRPFFTTKPGGSGLGLSTCYRIMSTHRGRIEVTSELGKGTTFACIMPLA